MSKTIKNCFYKKLTFENILNAHIRASKGKKDKKELVLFEMDLETNLIKILDDIKNNKYKFGDYREFKVYEPKERLIKSLPYRDRIVHQWYIHEFIKPYYYPRFIKDSYACIENRGTHAGVITLQKYMRIMKRKYNNYYVLKCDIKKFFYNIDKSILINILSKTIKDKKLLSFTKIILNDNEKIGIPIGNYTSQFFANIYLNELDHFIKDKKHIKYYIRYMDDFILLLETKEECIKLLSEIDCFVNSKLNLKLNNKSRYYKSSNGIDFCGYRIYETHILLRKRFKNKVNKNIKLWKKLKNENKFCNKKFTLSYNSLKAHASHSNSYNYFKKIDLELEDILKNNIKN